MALDPSDLNANPSLVTSDCVAWSRYLNLSGLLSVCFSENEDTARYLREPLRELDKIKKPA